MGNEPIIRESLNSLAYGRLCRDLKSGVFAPGEKLKLRNLAAEMGISTTPVREALARLISEQALEQVGHHSVRVPVMTDGHFAEVCVLRLMLEGRLASQAATAATLSDVRRLEGIHDEMAAYRQAGDARAELSASERFHMEVYALAGMPVMLRMVEGLWLQCGPLMRGLQTRSLSQPRKQHPHRKVLRGLRTSDSDMARAGIEEEIERTSAPLLAYLRDVAATSVDAPLRAGATV